MPGPDPSAFRRAVAIAALLLPGETPAGVNVSSGGAAAAAAAAAAEGSAIDDGPARSVRIPPATASLRPNWGRRSPSPGCSCWT